MPTMTILRGTVDITSETIPGKVYTVTLRPCGHDTCHCEDFRYRSGGNLAYQCKHLRTARGAATASS